MEKTIADLMINQPIFNAGMYYGQATVDLNGCIKFSQKELQWMKCYYKQMINDIDTTVYELDAWCENNEYAIDKRYYKQLKNYRKFLSEIQRKVKKALNNGSW